MKDNLLISAGKSIGDGESIFIWDLRKNNTPLFKAENNQDMFSINVHNNILYYAGRNHQIGRLNLSNFEILKPYESVHTDTITSLATYKNNLVSASRDKNIKKWDISENVNYPVILNAHNDWVNCVSTDNNQKNLYSSGKEGKIKVWRGQNSIRCVGEIPGHPSSVNCMASLQSNELISGGTDKFIKVWKLLEENSGSDSEIDNN